MNAIDLTPTSATTIGYQSTKLSHLGTTSGISTSKVYRIVEEVYRMKGSVNKRVN